MAKFIIFNLKYLHYILVATFAFLINPLAKVENLDFLRKNSNFAKCKRFTQWAVAFLFHSVLFIVMGRIINYYN
jgi:hypothetical protein